MMPSVAVVSVFVGLGGKAFRRFFDKIEVLFFDARGVSVIGVERAVFVLRHDGDDIILGFVRHDPRLAVVAAQEVLRVFCRDGREVGQLFGQLVQFGR